jgi:hypothetical protein
MPQCKLCLKNKKLSKSHIIPEFMYKRLYDNNHKFYEVDKNNQRPIIKQKGIREKLLCEDCEKIFQKSEDYFSKILDKNFQNLTQRLETYYDVFNLMFVEGFDYQKTSHFFLSMVWRCIISSLPMFKDCNSIGFEENIRKILLSNGKISNEQFPIVMSALNSITKNNRLIAAPIIITTTIENIEYKYWRINTGNFIFQVWLSDKNIEYPKYVDFVKLKDDGSVRFTLTFLENTGEFRSLPEIMKNKKK